MATKINEKYNYDNFLAVYQQHASTPLAQDNFIPTSVLTKGQKIFSSKDEMGNMPKPKTLYFVHFDLNSNFCDTIKKYHPEFESVNISKMKKFSFEISKLVKEYTKPKISFKTTELNEYNRKRRVYKSIDYDKVKISFYDVRSSTVQQLFFFYLYNANQDILNKTFVDIDNFNYSNNTNWGLTIDSNIPLFNNICLCEYFANTLTVYTLKNPKIISINVGSSKMGDFDSNNIEVEFEYDSVSNDLISDDINLDNVIGDSENFDSKLSNFLQLRYTSTKPKYIYSHKSTNSKSNYDSLFKQNIQITDNYKEDYTPTVSNAPSFKNDYKVEMYKINSIKNKMKNELLGDAWSIMKAYLNKDVKFSWDTVKNQALDTARKYGFAEEANAISQAAKSYKIIKNNSFKENIKYGINAIGDPTTLTGNVEKSFTGMASNIKKRLGGWFD
jgi:hypothetical protein